MKKGGDWSGSWSHSIKEALERASDIKFHQQAVKAEYITTSETRRVSLGAMDELSGLLQSYPWDSFVTDTFKKRVMFPRQAMTKVWDRLKSEVIPIRRAFLAAEEHYLGGWHVHGLLEFEHSDCGDTKVVLSSGELYDLGREVGETPALVYLERIRLAALGWCRVEEVKAIGGCAGYCSKYVTKELADYDFYGNWREAERVRL